MFYCRLDEVAPKMDEVLKNVTGNGVKHFDIERIHNFIDSKIISTKKSLENSPKSIVPDASIFDMLYGERPEHLQTFLTSSLKLERLKEKDEQFWLDEMERIFIKTPSQNTMNTSVPPHTAGSGGTGCRPVDDPSRAVNILS